MGDSPCFGVGYDKESYSCSKLCAYAKECELKTKQYMLGISEEVKEYKSGETGLPF